MRLDSGLLNPRGAGRAVLSANAVLRQGGQGLNLQHMLEALSGFDVRLFSRGGAGSFARQVPRSALLASVGRIPFLRRSRDLVALLDDLQFDHFVARSMPEARFFQGVVGQCAVSMEVAKGRGAHTILDVVNTHVDDFKEHVDRESRKFGLAGFISAPMRERILREYELADAVRVMSERAKRTFLARGFPESRVTVATPPIDVTAFPVADFREPTFRVCFVGLIEPWKGFHYLLEAFERLGAPDAELILWGGSGSRAATKMLADYRARVPSIRVRAEEIRVAGLDEVFGRSSVLVHPSLADGFSYAVAEAMASGLPVIVTDNTGAADLVTDGVNGYVVPVADSRAITERLSHLYKNRHLLPEMGRKARERVASLTLESFRAPLLRAYGGLERMAA